jgi:5-(carboxyamino)imidazole ribonucleotide synthase
MEEIPAAPILPGATLGMVGGGQLGRMFVVEARRMGYRVAVLDPGADPPAAQVANEHLRAGFADPEAMRALASRCAAITLEWENADVATLRSIERGVPVRPGPQVLEVAQHRVREKDAARRLGVGTAEYRAVGSLAELAAALREIGTPAVLKTARWGYDGKGQVVIRDAAEAEAAFASVAGAGQELILEAWVPFERELSVICARGPNGEVATFPVAENVHRNAILDLTLVPARIPPSVADEARRLAEMLAAGLGVVGLLAAELFLTSAGGLLLNELAPRSHNSGHYTLEACPVSQFEQQVRAVCGLPLGGTRLLRAAAMVNLLGEDAGTVLGNAGVPGALAQPETTLHLYGKHEARPGRKMGHLTALGDSAEQAAERAQAARAALAGAHARH